MAKRDLYEEFKKTDSAKDMIARYAIAEAANDNVNMLNIWKEWETKFADYSTKEVNKAEASPPKQQEEKQSEPQKEEKKPLKGVVNLVTLSYDESIFTNDPGSNSARRGKFWVKKNFKVWVNRVPEETMRSIQANRDNLVREIESLQDQADRLEDQIEDIEPEHRQDLEATIRFFRRKIDREQAKVDAAPGDIRYYEELMTNQRKVRGRAMMIARKLGDSDVVELLKNPDQYTHEAKSKVAKRYIGVEFGKRG